MKKLIAKRPVLYLGRMYDKGDTLPANDQKMVTAWLNAKSAAWDGQEAKESRQEAQESAKQADGSQDSRGQNGGQEAQENGPAGRGYFRCKEQQGTGGADRGNHRSGPRK